MLLTVSLVSGPLASGVLAQGMLDRDDERTADSMLVDTVFSRPLGFISMALGSVLFLVSAPLSVAGGNDKEAFEKLVTDPARYTFRRPLGELP